MLQISLFFHSSLDRSQGSELSSNVSVNTLSPRHSCTKITARGLLSPLFSCGIFIWCNHSLLKPPFRAFFLSGFTKNGFEVGHWEFFVPFFFSTMLLGWGDISGEVVGIFFFFFFLFLGIGICLLTVCFVFINTWVPLGSNK